VDTDRDRDIALLEIQTEHQKLVEEYYREKLGKRGMQNAESGQGVAAGNAPASTAGPTQI